MKKLNVVDVNCFKFSQTGSFLQRCMSRGRCVYTSEPAFIAAFDFQLSTGSWLLVFKNTTGNKTFIFIVPQWVDYSVSAACTHRGMNRKKEKWT